MYNADPNEYDGRAILGTCNNGFGSVHLAMHRATNTLVVIKKLFIDNNAQDEYSLIEQDIIAMRQMQHPNILPYLSAFVNEQSIWVVSPLMGYGSCSNLLNEYFTSGLPELAIAFILRDVMQGLDYIHRRGLIHRAVKASHILISVLGQVYLSGMKYACHIVDNEKWSRQIFSFPKSTANNLKWLSPELLEQDLRGYNEKSDIYSLGMTICELANGVVPFDDVPATLMLTEKVRGRVPHIIDCSTFPTDAMDMESVNDCNADSNSLDSSMKHIQRMSTRRFSDSFHAITELCLQRNPDNRPSASQLLNHAFIKQCRKSEMCLIDLLKEVTSIDNRNYESAGDCATNLYAEIAKLDIESCQWDF